LPGALDLDRGDLLLDLLSSIDVALEIEMWILRTIPIPLREIFSCALMLLIWSHLTTFKRPSRKAARRPPWSVVYLLPTCFGMVVTVKILVPE
jgi:hypothetical protein